MVLIQFIFWYGLEGVSYDGSAKYFLDKKGKKKSF